MAEPIRLARVEFASVRATERTDWAFAEVFDSQGTVAVVEVSSADATAQVMTLVRELVSALRDQDIAADRSIPGLLKLTLDQLMRDRPLATAVSALRTAVVDLWSQQDNLSITEALGGEPQKSVALYANINRSLLIGERTASAFGAAAERAVKQGFTDVKCAPFDEVSPPAAADEILDMSRPGLDRVAAVRAAVGPDVRVLVDCHSRFEAHTAPVVAEELARLDVGWFEEPLEPTKDAAGLAQVAEQVGMPVAGGEHGYGEDFFADLVRRKAVSIIMPDVKYCGGVAEAWRAGRAAVEAGGKVSLHSPSGPVSQLASAHVTAAIPGALALEHAVGEALWRAGVLVPPERIEGGRLWLPRGSGLGATLNRDVVTR